MKSIEEIFEEFKEGRKSVRKLALENGIPFATLRDKLRKVGGKDYVKQKAGEGTINAIIQEIMEDTISYSEVELKEITEWYQANYTQIIKDRGRVVYTTKKIGQLERTTVSLNESLVTSVRN